MVEKQNIKTLSFWSVVLTSIIVSLIISLVTYKFIGPYLDELLKKEVEVPNVSNLEVEHAKLILESKNLNPKIQDEIFSSEIPKGKIAKQNPLPGILVKENSEVLLFVSKGTEKVIIPFLNFLSVEDAKSQLTVLGFNVGEIKYENSNAVPKDRIISSEPVGGSEVEKGTTINLIVSKGAKPRPKPLPPKVIVPDLTGKTLPEAQEILFANGLILGKISKTTDITKEFDIILKQTPGPNTKVPKGTAVKVTINAEALSE